MMIKKLILTLCSVGLLHSCSDLSPMRTDLSAGKPKSYSDRQANSSALEVIETKGKEDILLYHVEFKNDGNFQTVNGQTQLKFLQKSLPEQIKRKRKQVLIISYLHGWSGDSHYLYPHLYKFKEMLHEINRSKSDDRIVVGVFMSWKGYDVAPIVKIKDLNSDKPASEVRKKTILGTVAHPFSFWSVKSRGHRVGRNGVRLTMETLQGIKNWADDSDKEYLSSTKNFTALSNNPVNSRYVHFGHSFGSAGTISAISPPSVEGGTDFSASMLNRSERLADFVIMTNPAFEGDRLRSHYRKMISDQADSNNKAPRVLVASAKNDIAVGLAFPVGQLFGVVIPKNYKAGRTPRSHLCGAGFYKPYHTHSLHYSGDEFYLKTVNSEIKNENFLNPDFKTFFRNGEKPYVCPVMTLQAKDKKMMDGHGGIWSDEFREFVTATILFADRQIKLENALIK